MVEAQGPWVMVVEDDEELREVILVPALAVTGFNVVAVGSARETYREMLSCEFALFVIDVGLPEEDGFSIVRHLRGLTRAGLILLTGRASVGDRVRGLDVSADAYLAKPVDASLLVATLRSIGRRVEVEDVPQPDRKHRASGWTFDLNGWRLIAPSGGTVKLSVAERELLELLLEASGQVVPRKRIVARLVAKISGFEEERLEMLIFRLRRKASAAAQPRLLSVRSATS